MKTFSSTILSVLLLALPAFGCMAMDDPGSSDDEVEQSVNTCQAPALEVIVKGRENRFGLDGQQVALNPSIPIDRICKRVAGSCKQACADAKARAEATGIRGFQDADPVKLHLMGVLADDFNAALGLTTHFADLGSATPPDPAQQACNAKLLQVLVKGKEHRFGFDGRQVALNPAIPIQNICQQVAQTCKSRCAAAQSLAVATGIKGFSGNEDPALLRKMGALADSFNLALGNPTNFQSGPIDLN
jgi:hypothetical protein